MLNSKGLSRELYITLTLTPNGFFLVNVLTVNAKAIHHERLHMVKY